MAGIKGCKKHQLSGPEGGDRNPDRSQRCRQKLHPAFYCRSGKAKDRQHQIKWKEIAGKTPEQIVSQGITLVPEGRRVFADLTVLENLKIGAYMRKDSLEEDINWCYDLFPRLKERNWQLAGTLSGGEQQMLALPGPLCPDRILS